MNDPRLLKERPDEARKAVSGRGGRHLPQLEEFLGLNERHLELLRRVEALRARRNASSAEIGKAKAAKDEARARNLMEEVSGLKLSLKEDEKALEEVASRSREAQLGIPNLPHASVPPGAGPEDNVERRLGGPEPRREAGLPDHQAVGERLGILDLEAAARLSGSRFALLKGAGARLERALISYMLDLHVGRHGYLEVWPPSLVRPEMLEGTGQLPKFRDDMYGTQTRGEDGAVSGELFLVSTAEVPLTNLARERIIPEAELPMKLTAYTPCFRQEAGSYGKDTRGLIRVHQFDKVELVRITRPEDSMAALEELTADAEAVLAGLGLPYRVVELCAADLGFASCKTYDLEVWMAAEGRYREISSCSNCWDFQARRMNARFRRGVQGPTGLVHTLNGSGVAVGRAMAAILEGFHRPDGSVAVPEALRPYFGSDSILSALR